MAINAAAQATPPATVRPVSATWPRWKEYLTAHVFLLPIVLVVLALFLVPILLSGYYSLTSITAYSKNLSFVGFANYVHVFQDSTMLQSLYFTLLYAVCTTLAVTALAIPLAIVLNRKFAGRNFVRSVFFFPAVPSVAILGLVWGFIFNPLSSGVINSILKSLFNIAPIPWLSNDQLAQLSVIIVAVWAQTGWHAILYLAYLQSIPGELYEVAMMDGASARQRLFGITLPLLTPAITVSTLLLLTGGLKVYDLPFTLTQGGPGFATYTLTQSIINDGVAQGNIGQGSALAVVFLLFVAILMFGQLFLTRKLEERYS